MTKEDLLEAYSIDEIEEILKKRKEQRGANPPAPQENPDFTGVTAYVKNMFDEFKRTHYWDTSDFDTLGELVIEAVYGKDVWEWIRAHAK